MKAKQKIEKIMCIHISAVEKRKRFVNIYNTQNKKSIIVEAQRKFVNGNA
jgi:hypothetical protein